ncbi:MAG: hypothetical protein H7Y22_16455, partial [Gemmatimonadaceae bacterium]|nr:hypothetical protein [Gloeobacterales cyanobacterium ES-bin-141]
MPSLRRMPGTLLLIGTLTAAAAAPVGAQTIRRPATDEPIERRSVSLRTSSLQASIGYTRIEFDVNRPLAHATGGQVPFTVKYSGSGNVASVQVPGSLSYPLGAHAGSFEQTVSNADIRAIMKRDEAAILARCTST